MFKRRKQKPLENIQTKSETPKSLEALLETCQKSVDFHSFKLTEDSPYHVYYIETLVKPELVHDDILLYLKKSENTTLLDLKKDVPVGDTKILSGVPEIEEALMLGHVLVRSEVNPNEVLSIPALFSETRSISAPEVEFSVVGPKDAFVEPLNLNLNLIRRRLPISTLIVDEIKVGDLSHTRIAILHIKGIADTANVHTAIQRIRDIQYDQIADSSFIAQMISDHSSSPFPQLIDTERPDRVSSALAEGKVVIIVDGSPQVLTGPTTLIEFFSAFEDYFIAWPLASIFRLIRLVAVLFSTLSTALYVSVVTYHYEMIPSRLLDTLVSSRIGIPLPPIVEAIVLELVIELLREAGARLPTKIGQTIGIVGGIVIGTAAVEAGLTSNVLLIVVALTALASFTTPVYQMSNAIRLIRFPFILFAQWLGFLGVSICFAFLLSHLLKLTSLGRPYLSPIYPLRATDFKDAFFRLPFNLQWQRPISVRSQQTTRSKPHDKRKKRRDIEE
ncbi:spore germination protein [Shouchella patagoniensis]|uniref:spore germination protein n=1 Tax=Shouchella patagoniensis TaxID=228576 RepID=UPI000995B1F3|nr:spore germination protein [Shouchella patagoniensis]